MCKSVSAYMAIGDRSGYLSKTTVSYGARPIVRISICARRAFRNIHLFGCHTKLAILYLMRKPFIFFWRIIMLYSGNNNLVGIYGAPARGYAGGYLA